MQFVVLTTPIRTVGKVKPIIGPPITTRCCGTGEKPWQSSKCLITVPSKAHTLPGLCIVLPVTVTTRSINGLPSYTACCIANKVPVLCTKMPISAGMPPLGT